MTSGRFAVFLAVALLALLPTTAAHANTPPEINPSVPNLVVRNTDPSFTIDLTAFETDLEEADPQLTWSISGFDSALFSASVDPDDILTITPVAGEVGSDSALLTLSDGALDDTQTIGITIDQGPVNVAYSGDAMTVAAETVYLRQFDSLKVNNSGQLMFYANSKAPPAGPPDDGSPEGPCVIATGDGSGPPTLLVADGDPVPDIPENAGIEPGSLLFICDPGLPGAFLSSDPQFNNDGGIAFLATVVQPTLGDIEAIFYKASAIDPVQAVAVGGQSCPSGLPPGGTLTPLFAFVILDMDSKVDTNVLYGGLCDYPVPPDLEFMAVGFAGSVGTKFIAVGDSAPGTAGGAISNPLGGGSLAGGGVLRASGGAGCTGGTGGCAGAGGRIIVTAEPGQPLEKVVATGDTWFSGDPTGDVTFTDIDITVPPVILGDGSTIFQATASDPYGGGYFIIDPVGAIDKSVLENDPAYAGDIIGPITFGGGGGGGGGGGAGGGRVLLGITESYGPTFQRLTAYPSGALIDYVGEPIPVGNPVPPGGNRIGAILDSDMSEDGENSGSTYEADSTSCSYSSCQGAQRVASGTVVAKPRDTANDGISDAEEDPNRCGIDADGDGVLDRVFDLDGDGNCDVDPDKPDIFNEYDYMSCLVAPENINLPADCMEDKISTCNDGIDNGGLSDGTDTGDSDCHTDGDAANGFSYNPTLSEDGITTCNDGIDNGSDGFTDGADPECHEHMPAGVSEDGATGIYACENGGDPDADNPDVINGQIDLNLDATVDSADTGTIAGVDIIAGGVDIDGSGTVDASDDGSFIGFHVKDGGIDINADGIVGGAADTGSLGELADPDCSVVAAFANSPVHNTTADEDGLTTCNDGIDNGGASDGSDITDTDCHTDGTLTVSTYDPNLNEDGLTACNDGFDNDGADGLIDAADPDCTGVNLHVFIDEGIAHAKFLDFTDPTASPTCADGRDNGGADNFDANDPDCHWDSNLANPYEPTLPEDGSVPAPCTGGVGGYTLTDPDNSKPVKIAGFEKVKGDPTRSPSQPIHFGTIFDRSVQALATSSITAYVNPSGPTIPGGRSARMAALFRINHYALLTHRQAPADNDSSGCGEMPGNDFYVSLGGNFWKLNGTTGEREGTEMHELGHNLDLCHGGPNNLAQDDGQCSVNYKPNYLSVMNYSFQMPTTPGHGPPTGRPLDYSRWELLPPAGAPCASTAGLLDENSLDEGCGIDNNNPPSFPTGFASRNTAYTDPSCAFKVVSATGSIDWNTNSSIEGVSQAGSNIIAAVNDYSNPCVADKSTLNGYVDWDNLLYNISTTAGYSDGMPNGPVLEESGSAGDGDSDGLADSVDDDPGTPSTGFSDTAQGGTTDGSVVSGTVSVRDADDLDEGVLISADAASNVSICAGAVTVDLDEPDGVVVTCGSATVTVLQGPADVTFGGFTATVPTGSTIIIVEGPPAFCPSQSGGWQITHTASGSSDVTVTPGSSVLSPGSVARDCDVDVLLSDVDNCPTEYNPSQTNTDVALAIGGATIGSVAIGDGLGDACDDDDDDDGTADVDETPGKLGTDPLDNCGVNAWPPDTDDNFQINAGDFGLILFYWQETVTPSSQRADLDTNGVLNAGDFGSILAFWQKACT